MSESRKVRVDLGVPCSKQQSNHWVGHICGEMMRVASEGRIEFGQSLFIGGALTDFARNDIANKFLSGTSDYLYFIDDDVVPPQGALETLLEMKLPFANGVYFLRRPPCNPIAYDRNPDGSYSPIEFKRGEVKSVDSVGLGCALIHRGVFEKIMEEYSLFVRKSNRTFRPVHNSKIVQAGKVNQVKRQAGNTLKTPSGVFFVEELVGPINPGEKPWPFFQFEANRTEDHWFAELVKKVGFEIIVNTEISCLHWGARPVSEQSYREMLAYQLSQGV